jgi:hypothetical protein
MARRVIRTIVLNGLALLVTIGLAQAQATVVNASGSRSAVERPIGPADHVLYINRQPAELKSPTAPLVEPPGSQSSILTRTAANSPPTPEPAAPATKNARSADQPIGPADHILYVQPHPVLHNSNSASVGRVISNNSAAREAAAKFGPSPLNSRLGDKGVATPGELALLHTSDGSDLDPINWSVMVYKSRHLLNVYYKGHFFRSYRAVFGRNLDHRPKEYAGDRRTPEGVYSIIRKYPSARFRWFLKLNYPNDIDWARFDDLEARHLIPVADVRSPGSSIGIHGTDEPLLNEANINWTTGCISVDNAAISQLARLLPVGTLVIIKP